MTTPADQPANRALLTIDSRWWRRRADWAAAGRERVLKASPAAMTDAALCALRGVAYQQMPAAPLLCTWLLDHLDAERERRDCEDDAEPREIVLAVLQVDLWTHTDAWSAVRCLIRLVYEMRHHPSAAALITEALRAFTEALEIVSAIDAPEAC